MIIIHWQKGKWNGRQLHIYQALSTVIYLLALCGLVSVALFFYRLLG